MYFRETKNYKMRRFIKGKSGQMIEVTTKVDLITNEEAKSTTDNHGIKAEIIKYLSDVLVMQDDGSYWLYIEFDEMETEIEKIINKYIKI